jgi:hypothetical protein
MSFATYGEISGKVLDDLDLRDEVFFTTDELLGYCHEAIREAEATINKLCEDYLLSKASISLVSGTAAYDFPTDIFADKIRALIYRVGTTVYPIKRMRFKDAFEDIGNMEAVTTTQLYRYLVTNTTAAGRKIVLYPTPVETAAAAVTVWFIRNLALPADDSDEIEIPEFRAFVEQHMKVRLLEKEGNPNLPYAKQVLEQERQMMVDSLSNRFPDNDDELEQDMSFYMEHN